MARRRVSRGVGRSDVRKLDGCCCCCCCLVFEVGVGDGGCLGMLPLRLIGADIEGAICRDRGCIYVFYIAWVGRARNTDAIARCLLCECQRSFAMSRQLDRRFFCASPRPSLATDICTACVFQPCSIRNMSGRTHSSPISQRIDRREISSQKCRQ